LQANTVTVSVDAPTDAAPSVAAQHTLSDDGVNFSSSLNLGNLAADAISGVLTLRRTTPSNAAIGPWTARLLAQAASWS
jgi:hypothetical protein